jgi:hypothetical protein
MYCFTSQVLNSFILLLLLSISFLSRSVSNQLLKMLTVQYDQQLSDWKTYPNTHEFGRPDLFEHLAVLPSLIVSAIDGFMNLVVLVLNTKGSGRLRTYAGHLGIDSVS